jgi:hypothetical protein
VIVEPVAENTGSGNHAFAELERQQLEGTVRHTRECQSLERESEINPWDFIRSALCGHGSLYFRFKIREHFARRRGVLEGDQQQTRVGGALVLVDDAALDVVLAEFRCCRARGIARPRFSEPPQRCSFSRIVPLFRGGPAELLSAVSQQMPCGAQQKVTVCFKRRIQIGQAIKSGEGRQCLLQNQIGIGFLTVERNAVRPLLAHPIQVRRDLAPKIMQVAHCERTGVVEELSIDLRRPNPTCVRGVVVAEGV